MTIDARFVTLLVALSLGGCSGGVAEEGDASAALADADTFGRVVNVEVQQLEAANFTELVQVTGTVRANRDVVISAEEAGVVREVKRYAMEDGRVIDPVSRKTATRGRELGFVEQIFGNLGRFNNADPVLDF